MALTSALSDSRIPLELSPETHTSCQESGYHQLLAAPAGYDLIHQSVILRLPA